METGRLQDAGACADDAHNGSMRTCKTCRKYRGCLESGREYPCRDWERRDKRDRRHDGNHTAAAGARADPARSHAPADHRPGTAQDHPAQAGAEGQVSEVADRDSVRITGDEYDSVSDHLHIAGRTNLRRRWRRCQKK